ncbi:MAG: HAD family phosphatase, partial [Bdellovibrionales bacterium]|nr:HAD family phosphatase [Bdellovibrionales bacterium]
QTLIFDLGNVLVSFHQEQMFSQIATLTGLTPEVVREIMIDQRIGHQVERGLITPEEVHQTFQIKTSQSFPISEFLQAASTVFSPRKEMETLVQTLKQKRYQLILLSNTSEPHYTYVATHYTVLTHFDHIVLSYEVGSLKPEKAIFEHALSQGNASPSRSFFIDDILENVHGAERLGIRGHHFTSLQNLMHDLIQTGIL